MRVIRLDDAGRRSNTRALGTDAKVEHLLEWTVRDIFPSQGVTSVFKGHQFRSANWGCAVVGIHSMAWLIPTLATIGSTT